MSDQDHKSNKTVSHVGIRTLAVAFIVIAIFVAAAIYIGLRFYATKKEALQLQCEVNAKDSAREYDRCLLTRANIVTVVGYAVDTMMKSGKDNQAILEYLTSETNYIVATLDPSTTGLYGLFNGEYLDGSGWTPDADYVPTERPWYIQTLQSDREITFVEPYLDMQTETVMMTVTDLLTDGKSVIAMDVSLDPIQKIIENVTTETEGSQALVLDANGIVVAHSDKSQLGVNYLAAADGLGHSIADSILVQGQMQFDLSTEKGNFSVYVDKLEGGWFSVSLIDTDIWYQPLRRTTVILGIGLAVIVTLLTFVFLRLNAKNRALQRLHTRIDQEERRGNELQLLSETDRMTGLYDRVSGERKVNALLDANVEGMFLELDIDNFKSINDTYGHQVGDQVILAVAEALHSTFRSNDITMRLGGDEFGVFAVGITKQEMAEAIIHRLFQHLDCMEVEGLGERKVTGSVGAVLSTGNKAENFGELYTAVDTAMYTSKKQSGNSLTFGSL